MSLDPSIALNVQRPDMMQNLGSMLNIGNAALQLQKNRATFDADVAQRQAESQKAVGTVQPTIDTATANAISAQQFAQQQKLATLQAHVENGAKQMLSLHGTGASPDDVAKVVKDTMTNAGAPPEAINQALSQIPADPSQIDKFIINKAQSALALSGQISSKFPAPQMVNNGQVQIPVATGNPNLTGVTPGAIQGAGIQNQISPSEQQTFGTDAGGRPLVVSKSPSGEITNVGGAPVNGQQTPGPLVLPQNETAQSMQDLIAKRQAISDAAAQVPDQHYNNQAIKKILNEGGVFSPTGSNAGFVAKIGGAIGVPMGEDNASNINTINHYLALQTQAAEKAMGVHTDAGQAVAGAAAGSVVQDPKSLRTTVNINDATSSALDFYNRGKEAAIKNGGANGIFAQRDFQNAWSQAYGRYGPFAMRLMNAGQTGDTAEVNAVINELGGKKSAKFQQMLFTARRLDKLANTGKP